MPHWQRLARHAKGHESWRKKWHRGNKCCSPFNEGAANTTRVVAVAVLQQVAMPAENVTVFVYSAVADLVNVLGKLARLGAGMESVSVISVDRETATASAAYHIETGEIQRAPCGDCLSFTRLLKGCTVLLTPGFPAVVIAGPLGRCFSRMLPNEALFEGMGAIAGTLYALGIARGAACRYETAALNGGALVVVHGRARDVARVRALLVRGE